MTPAGSNAARLLARELESLIQRLAGFSPTRWSSTTAGGATRAEVIWRFAEQLAAAGWRAGTGAPQPAAPQPGAPVPAARWDSPDLPLVRPGDHALADVVAVLGHELLSAPAVDDVAPALLAAVLAARTAVDGTPPPADAAAAARVPAADAAAATRVPATSAPPRRV